MSTNASSTCFYPRRLNRVRRVWNVRHRNRRKHPTSRRSPRNLSVTRSFSGERIRPFSFPPKFNFEARSERLERERANNAPFGGYGMISALSTSLFTLVLMIMIFLLCLRRRRCRRTYLSSRTIDQHQWSSLFRFVLAFSGSIRRSILISSIHSSSHASVKRTDGCSFGWSAGDAACSH